jgi:hypothetical protein
MSLEDARTIADYYRRLSVVRRLSYDDKTLAICQMLLAMDILERHLPVPLYLPIDHYLWLGKMRARGATFIPWP